MVAARGGRLREKGAGRALALLGAGLVASLATGCRTSSEPQAVSESHEADRLPCVYTAAATELEPEPELAAHAGCSTLDPDGHLVIEAAHLSAADYVEGQTEMFIAGAWYYVRRDGASLRVLTWDNGPDPWSEGLARSLRDGSMVYSNRSFEEVVGPTYDWGWPFEEGLALVCSGCSIAEEAGSEHRSVAGGTWGFIDSSGDEVVPVRYDRETALELRDRQTVDD